MSLQTTKTERLQSYMTMTLNTLEKGKSATITAINAGKELKNRFNSFGIVKGSVIYAERHSLAKQTMEIRVNKTLMALRFSEAENIEIMIENDEQEKN